VVNAGVSGETSSGTRSRIDWIVSSLDPDIVILETGANDGLRGIEPRLIAMNLDAICTLLKKNVVVLLAGMKMLPSLGPEYTKAFVKHLSTNCQQTRPGVHAVHPEGCGR
jgi:acyl-CoA thioesterase I